MLAFLVLIAVACCSAVFGYETVSRSINQSILESVGTAGPGEILVLGIASDPSDASAINAFSSAVLDAPGSERLSTSSRFGAIEESRLQWMLAGVSRDSLVREVHAAIVMSVTPGQSARSLQVTFPTSGRGFESGRLHALLGRNREFELLMPSRPEGPEILFLRTIAEYLAGDGPAALVTAREGLSSEGGPAFVVPWFQAITGLCLHEADQCDRALLFLREAHDAGLRSPAVDAALEHCETQMSRATPADIVDAATEVADLPMDATAIIGSGTSESSDGAEIHSATTSSATP